MTDPRDYRHDPRPSEPRNDLRGGYRENDVSASDSRTGTSIWSWLAGIAAAIFIIAVIYGFTNRDTQTAIDSNAPPARTDATTGAGTTGAGGATTSGSGTTAPGQPAR
jgi:hypothetical protein